MRFASISVTIALALLIPAGACRALSMDQFASACDSYAGDCSTIPWLQAYVGGALDLVAMLDEETDYLGEIYCREPNEFFDTQEIIRYMLANRSGNEEKNAMMLVIRYLEEMGGCRKK